MSVEPFPVLRTGDILRPKNDRGLSPEQSVYVARALYNAASDLSARFENDVAKTIKNAERCARDAEELPAGNAATRARLRFAPTLTMDFASSSFRWQDFAFEVRPVAAMCPGQTRGKLWVRLNGIEQSGGSHSVSDVRERLFDLGPPLKSLWLTYFNEVCGEVTRGITFEPVYALNVFMTSSDGKRHNIRKLLDDFAAPPAGDRPTEAAAIEALNAELSESAGITIPASNDVTMRRIVTYRFPRHHVEKGADGNGLDVETIADEDFEALCAVEIAPTKTDVFGIGLEPERPDHYRRSASHVTSAEISYELGHIF